MADVIRIFEHGTDERTALENFALAANTVLKNYGVSLFTRDIYFDAGQNWMWTTLVACDAEGTSWQAFYPKQQEAIIAGDTRNVFGQVLEYVKEHAERRAEMAAMKAFSA